MFEEHGICFLMINVGVSKEKNHAKYIHVSYDFFRYDLNGTCDDKACQQIDDWSIIRQYHTCVP